MILLVVFFPLAAGLLSLLLQRGYLPLLLTACLMTAGTGVSVLAQGTTVELTLTGPYGVSLLLDRTGAWFLLLNALVCAAAAWHEHAADRAPAFLMLVALLHGGMNACFVSADLFNLYVVIELTSIAAFLLIGIGLTTRQLWNALRYLFLSNIGMLFFLLGTLMVYESAGDFMMTSVGQAPPTARALILAGLMVKGGVFLPGLWLPQAHAEAEDAVAALHSGAVVSIGLLPILRLAACTPEIGEMLRLAGFGSIFTGLGLAFFQRDIKRLLACSTVSQVGFILIAPLHGAFYAFAHGVAKAALFLCVSRLPERDLIRLRQQSVDRPTAWLMAMAALSIAGAPPLLGFHAKYMITTASLPGAAALAAAAASVGTAALLTPIILLPARSVAATGTRSGRAPILLLCLVLLGGAALGPFSAAAWVKALAVLPAGLLVHGLASRHLIPVSLPDGWEKLEHVVGMTCMALILILVGVYLP